MSKAVVYDSTRKTRDNRPRGLTLSGQQNRSRRSSTVPTATDDGAGGGQIIHSTLKILTVASVVNSCLFLNLLAFVCIIPAIYYTFYILLAFVCIIPAIYYTFYIPDTRTSSKPREGRMLDRARRALVLNFLSLLSYIPYSVVVTCAIYFSTTT